MCDAGPVIDTLLEIPSHVRVRLASALESGLLAPPWTAMAIRATVGGGYDEPILHVLQLIAPSATGPAPRLDAHDPASFWRSPSITTPFDVTGGPALTLTAGFSEGGLPLGVQLAAAPFLDRLVLAAGQAFQAATEWGGRRPLLEADDDPRLRTYALPAPALPRHGAMLDEARMLAGLAGLPQDDEFVLALIAEAAPHARAMAGRLDRDYAFSDEI